MSTALGRLLVTGPHQVSGVVTVAADRLTLGRDERSDVLLDDVSVSRHHALLLRVGDDLCIRDLGSVNGTYVNGARVSDAALADGDVLRVGAFRMLVAYDRARSPRGAGSRRR